MKLRPLSIFGFVSTLCTVAAIGCGAADDDSPGGVGPGADDSPGIGDNGTGGGDEPQIGADDGGVSGPSDGRDLPVRKKVCDSAGANCTCLRLALLGTLDSAANNKDTQPFIDWLNGNSGGTATVTMVSSKPTLDAAYLAGYDILLVANVNSWTFSAEEKAAVEKWVRETGGGIISLTGFVSTSGEPAATSQLIEFSGVKFNSTTTAPGSGQSTPVYYKGGTEDLKTCMSGDAIITTPIQFTPQTGELQKLTESLDYVGAFVGWGVDAPSGATVVATDPVSGGSIAVAKEVDGKGRVFAFGDEWVVFKNQWEGPPNRTQEDQYNPCWIPPAEGETEGTLHSVQTLYQTKQFWYNAINWVAPPNECGFKIEDPDVVVR